MLDVQGALKNLQSTVTRHFLHIQNQHPFMRAWAVQFELAYTDFRVIQLALQLADEMDLLKEFTTAYDKVYQYESAFAFDGLDGFNAKYATKMTDYEKAKEELLTAIAKITKEQPHDPNDLI
ncbi:hypothetical protein [Candidatus Enterococcus leclercqii]|uniref:hypothetical protein n=1 Tax=Candidatus Enterococcus leclercqii TaxID=1857218 RepID=UPI00137B6BD2|nr:hypothetical protein [Enterococcus sp. CU9D]KAF1293928.1 hypothetical protein BAU14_11810 [Enterococcus sp. CU9D]